MITSTLMRIFFTSLTSKLITCYMMFHFSNEIQINCFINIWSGFQTLKLRSTQYGLCGLGNLQECNDNFLSKAGSAFQLGSKKVFILFWSCPRVASCAGPIYYPIMGPFLQKARWDYSSVRRLEQCIRYIRPCI